MTRWSEKEYEEYKKSRLPSRSSVKRPTSVAKSNAYLCKGRPPFVLPAAKSGLSWNKTEQRYAQEILEPMKRLGEIMDWRYEQVKFRIAKKTTYTPDFMVIYRECIEFIEIKGFLRDDAAVKFKTVRELFPWFRWRMIRYKKGEWVEVAI